MLTVIISLLAGCSNPCQEYFDAVQSCADEYAEANDTEAEDLVVDGYCDAYVSTPATDELHTCYTAAYNDNDCSTEEGYTKVSEDVAACAG